MSIRLCLAPPLLLLAGLVGCDSGDTKLADAPPVTIPPSQKPEELPKNMRPPSGSSAGMNYNPGGYGAQGSPPR